MNEEKTPAAGAAGEKSKAWDDVAKEARERYDRTLSRDEQNRRAMLDDLKFVWVPGSQWPDYAKLDRQDRPMLELNQLPQFLKQVVNDQRQVRPSIKIRPGDAKSSAADAKVAEGVVRGIEYKSNASAVYDSGFELAVTGGRGYWRVLTDYESEKSFNQEIKLRAIPDPMSVVMDQDYVEPDASDIRFCFVTESIPKDEFKARYPDEVPADWSSIDARWVDGENVVIADYYRAVSRPRELVLLVTGEVAWKDELPEKLPPGVVLRKRVAEDRAVEWYKMFGGGVLEEIKWPGRYIPVIMCVGDELMVDGERIYQGLIRRARDPQMMYNFWQTTATELVALAPRQPWVVGEGQDEGFEHEYREANVRSMPVLHYKPRAVNGTLLPPPQRTPFAGIPSGVVEQAAQCKADLRATIGIYDPSLGARSNETSGRAIIARERQGDTATFHFVDNLSRAIALTGRVIVDLMPSIYDTQRELRAVEEDGSESVVAVNQTLSDGAVKNDIRHRDFAVVVDVGPSYATKRIEAAESMMQFLESFPQASPVIGDLVAKSMDWPGAEQIAERLKLLLPPEIKAAEARKVENDDPQTQMLVQQLDEVTRQGHEAVQAMQQQLDEALRAAGDTQAQNAEEIGRLRLDIERAREEVKIAREEVALKREEMTNRRRETSLKMMLELAKLRQSAQEGSLVQAGDMDEQIPGLVAGEDDDGVLAAVMREHLVNPRNPHLEAIGTQLSEQLAAFSGLAEEMRRLQQLIAAPRYKQLTLGPDGLPSGSVSTLAPPGGAPMQ